MSVPSQKHEDLVATLETLATLAGFTRPIALDDWLTPDVLRLDPRGGRVFLGDAKDSESSGCVATAYRLKRYALVLKHWREVTQADVVFAVAHGERHRRRQWVKMTARVFEETGIRPTSTGSFTIDSGCVLAWVCAETHGRDSPRDTPAELLTSM